MAAVTSMQFVNAQCSELFISEYVEGYNNNKALEIYNPKSTAVNLSGYRLVRWSNGSNTADADINYVQSLSGTIQPYSTFTFFLDKRNPAATGADTILEASLLAIANNIVNAGNGAFYSPDYNANIEGAKMMPFNGDDAVSLQKNSGGWTNVDIFGKIGEQPTNSGGTFSPTGGWTDTPPYNDGQGFYLSKDKTLIRKASVTAGVTANPASFNALAEYDSLQVGTYTNLGLHTCNCYVGVEETDFNSLVSVFPNPASGHLQVSLLSSIEGLKIHKVEMLNMLGEIVFLSENFPGSTSRNIEIDARLPKGIYSLKALVGEKQVVRRVILQ